MTPATEKEPTMTLRSFVGQVVRPEQINQLVVLPDGTVLYPVEDPDTPPSPSLRPIWRENSLWTDGRTSSPQLSITQRVIVLRVPALRVGDEILSARDLRELPPGTAVVSAERIVAQCWQDAEEYSWWFIAGFTDKLDVREAFDNLSAPVHVLLLPEGV